MDFLNKRESKREINITPLIDIVFLMLVFFMLVSRFDSFQTIEINISSQAKESNNIKDDSLIIEIMDKDILKIDNILIQNKDLSKEISKLERVGQVILIAKGSIKINKVVTIMDEIRSFGIKKIGIRSKP